MTWLKPIFALIVFVIVLSVPIAFNGPQLWRDLQTGTRWSVAPELAVKSANCTRWWFVVASCTFSYTDRRQPERVQPELNYFMFRSWAGERASLMRSTVDPTHVTVTLGIEHMTDRLIAASAYLGICLLFLGLLILAGVRFRLRQSQAQAV
jgi:hypothetical protein